MRRPVGAVHRAVSAADWFRTLQGLLHSIRRFEQSPCCGISFEVSNSLAALLATLHHFVGLLLASECSGYNSDWRFTVCLYMSLITKVDPQSTKSPCSVRHVQCRLCQSVHTNTVHFYTLLLDLRNSVAFWKVPRVRPFVLLVRAACR
jgi:hypothetical protein